LFHFRSHGLEPWEVVPAGGESIDPSNQLFGHHLRHRMDLQKSMAEQHNDQPDVKNVSGIGAAIGKLLSNTVSYYKYPATHKGPELAPDWSKKQLEQQAYHCLQCSHCPEEALAE
jgi:hypothetical protein